MNSGFTLIEVMIALFILIIIGVATSKAVVDAAKLKENLKDETEFSSEFRTSITLIERDLNQVFNPRWFLAPNQPPLNPYDTTAPIPGKPSAAEVNNRLRGMAFQSFEYWGKVYDLSGIRPSRFKGNEKSFSFITSSHTRIYRQKKESIYSKVKFEVVKQAENPNLTTEQNLKNADLSSLVKTENTHVFELEEPNEAPYIQYFTILNQIKSIRFRYYKKGEKNPLNTWDSDTEEFKGEFPEAVEMELTLRALNDRTMDANVLFKLEAPNEVLPTTY